MFSIVEQLMVNCEDKERLLEQLTVDILNDDEIPNIIKVSSLKELYSMYHEHLVKERICKDRPYICLTPSGMYYGGFIDIEADRRFLVPMDLKSITILGSDEK
ncbi:hypothetical protein AKJ51_01525 [candidate division MSBL1 archaeon SCGC-AAA382A20]|uniref:Uncharacterized protein n=1 Tax=candidate division MSBL1 archaeon SCGC-AAA382A20 TaxID=1698280 RepID=A0A133VLP0_9EURY|nr:hypothetical protein AKJ51_01525 [candidate division MSBL1 archaeon SCGC-AAA382A20]